MKATKHCGFFILAALVFSAAAAMAAESMKFWSYDMLTIQTPKDWTLEKDKNERITIFSADKSTCVKVHVLEPIIKETSREIAEISRAKVNGSELKDNGDGLFSFTFEIDGKRVRSIVGKIHASAIIISVTGEDPNLEAVMKSLKLKLTFVPSIGSLL